MALQEEFEQQGNWLFRYRSYLPLIALAIGTALFVRSVLHPETFILRGTPYEVYYEMVALLISLFGLFIRVYTVGHSPKNTSGRNTRVGQVADQLNTTGMYSIVRHPLYVGNLLMWFGPVMLTGHLWFMMTFCFLYWIYYERIMFAEEQFLRNKFGNAFIDWSRNVPAFIPKFRNFSKPCFPFSVKKVLKKEKNGLFALFFIFSLFDVAGEIITHETGYNYVLIALCGVTGICYLVLEFLKKKTRILDESNR